MTLEYFRKLGLDEGILEAIDKLNFEKPTEIQEKTIPYILDGKNVIASAKTGSGKTLAFGSAIIQNTKTNQGVQALVLTPTRELAVQVSDMLKSMTNGRRLKFATIYGGVAINPQIYKLREADVVVGTPGRIIDHLDRGTLDLRFLKILVLDEADRMLDMGFIDDVGLIMDRCPADKQIMLFSATMHPKIEKLIKTGIDSPVRVNVDNHIKPSLLKQIYYDVPQRKKMSLLVNLIRSEKSDLSIVFCNSRRTVDYVTNNLKLNDIPATALHGGLTQKRRMDVLQAFDAKRAKVLVATDVAARGLDIKGVTHVYNYDIPMDSKQYIHRIGRTARAGESGIAINILGERDHEFFDKVLYDNRLKIPRVELPALERIKIKRNFSEDQGNRFDQRRGGRRSYSNNRGYGFRGHSRVGDNSGYYHDGNVSYGHSGREDGRGRDSHSRNRRGSYGHSGRNSRFGRGRNKF